MTFYSFKEFICSHSILVKVQSKQMHPISLNYCRHKTFKAPHQNFNKITNSIIDLQEYFSILPEEIKAIQFWLKNRFEWKKTAFQHFSFRFHFFFVVLGALLDGQWNLSWIYLFSILLRHFSRFVRLNPSVVSNFRILVLFW